MQQGTLFCAAAAMFASCAQLEAQQVNARLDQLKVLYQDTGRGGTCSPAEHTVAYNSGSTTIPLSLACNGATETGQLVLQYPDTLPITFDSSGPVLQKNAGVTTSLSLSGHWTTPSTGYRAYAEIGATYGNSDYCPDVSIPKKNLLAGDTPFTLARPCTVSIVFPTANADGTYDVTLQHYVSLDVTRYDDGGLPEISLVITVDYKFSAPKPTDSVSFVAGTTQPDPAAGGIDGSSVTHFQATLQYAVGTVANANLSLRLYDQPGAGRRLLGATQAVAVARSDPANSTQALSLDLPYPLDANPDPTQNLPYTAEKLYLVGALVDPSGSVLAETNPQGVYSLLDLKPRIDVVQAVQDAANSVKLVRERDSVVRVYPLQTWASNNLVQNINGTLQVRVFDGSGNLLVASSDPLKPYSTTVAASDSVQGPDRKKESSSLNFLLPAEWVFQGDGPLSVELTAQLQPPADRTIQNTSHLSLVSDPRFSFVPSANLVSPLVVGYLKKCVNFGTVNACPTDAVSNAGNRMSDLYPVSLSGIDYTEMDHQPKPWTGPLDTNDRKRLKALAERAYLRNFAFFGVHKLVVWLPAAAQPLTRYNDGQGNTLVLNGWSDPPWSGGAGHVTFVFERADALGMARTVAHEVGHNLGLHHTATNDNYPGCIQSKDVKPADWATNGHYTDGTIQEPGFGTGQPTPVFKTPASNFDLMNYCPAAVTWISPYHYNQLFNAISALTAPAGQGGGNTPQAGGPKSNVRRGIAADAAAAPNDYLLVSGTVTQDGSSGQLDAAEHITSGLAGGVSDPNGSYCLRQTQGNGNTLDFCFSPVFTDLDGNSLTQDSFSFQIPYLPGAVQISLIPAGGLPGSQLAIYTSAGAPSVTIQGPQPGPTLSGIQQLVWSATDPANAPLSYIVDYSADGGNTWTPLSDTMASTLTDTQYTLDTRTLLGGTQIYFRVTATNGLDSAAASAGPFTIVNNPVLALDSPTLDFGNQTIGSSTDLQVTIKNSGTGMLNISSVSSDTRAFLVANGRMFIAGGGSRTLTVTFAPASTGTLTGKILVNGGDANGGATIAVQGVAFDHPVPSIAVSPSSLDFGKVSPANPKNLTLTVTNNGSGPLTVTAMTPSNTQFNVVSPPVPFTLSRGAQQSVVIRFTPSSAGAQKGTLSIASNDPTHSVVAVGLTANTP